MSTAVFNSVYSGRAKTPSLFSLLILNLTGMFAERRARSAVRRLHRHEALVADLSRRQDHAADFLIQSNDLPFKI